MQTASSGHVNHTMGKIGLEYWTIRRQTNSQSVKSRTGQLADESTHRQQFLKSRKYYADTIFVH